MNHIFYFIGIIFFLRSLSYLLAPVAKSKKLVAFNKLQKENKGKEWDEYTPEYKEKLKGYIWKLPLFLFPIFGLFSSVNWMLFLVYLIVSTAILAPLGKLLSGSKAHVGYVILSATVAIGVSLFAVLNAYHLRINIWQWVQGLW